MYIICIGLHVRVYRYEDSQIYFQLVPVFMDKLNVTSFMNVFLVYLFSCLLVPHSCLTVLSLVMPHLLPSKPHLDGCVHKALMVAKLDQVLEIHTVCDSLKVFCDICWKENQLPSSEGSMKMTLYLLASAYCDKLISTLFSPSNFLCHK